MKKIGKIAWEDKKGNESGTRRVLLRESDHDRVGVQRYFAYAERIKTSVRYIYISEMRVKRYDL